MAAAAAQDEKKVSQTLIWVGAASSVSHVGSTLFSDRDRLLQFQTHVSVKHDAQFDYSHPTSRVNFQKREN